MKGPNDSLPNDAVPAVLVLGPCAVVVGLPQGLIEVVERGLLQVERTEGVHAAAVRIATARPVAGVLLDLVSCSSREVAAISTFTRAGVAVWLLGADQKPARAADAMSRGGRPWSMENLDSWQVRTADVASPESSEFPQEDRPATPEMRDSAEDDGTMKPSPPETCDEFIGQPLVSNEEMRALPARLNSAVGRWRAGFEWEA